MKASTKFWPLCKQHFPPFTTAHSDVFTRFSKTSALDLLDPNKQIKFEDIWINVIKILMKISSTTRRPFCSCLDVWTLHMTSIRKPPVGSCQCPAENQRGSVEDLAQQPTRFSAILQSTQIGHHVFDTYIPYNHDLCVLYATIICEFPPTQ